MFSPLACRSEHFKPMVTGMAGCGMRGVPKTLPQPSPSEPDRLSTTWSFVELLGYPVCAGTTCTPCTAFEATCVLPFFRSFSDSNRVSGSCTGALPIELYDQIYCYVQ